MGRVALVTGSSRGIGAAIIREFAKNGIDVVINYRQDEERAKNLEEEIKSKYDVRVLTVKCDVSDEDEVESMVNYIVDTFGGIDFLVNNAGICRDSLLMDKNHDDFERVIDVNLIGTFLVSKYVARVMKDAGFGRIVNISSTNALDSFYPESAEYDASKAGVISLTHNLARELAPNISVNCVCPGWIKTDMNKDLSIEQINHENEKILLGRFGDPKEVSQVVVFLCSRKASYINDSIIRVDGGRKND